MIILSKINFIPSQFLSNTALVRRWVIIPPLWFLESTNSSSSCSRMRLRLILIVFSVPEFWVWSLSSCKLWGDAPMQGGISSAEWILPLAGTGSRGIGQFGWLFVDACFEGGLKAVVGWLCGLAFAWHCGGAWRESLGGCTSCADGWVLWRLSWKHFNRSLMYGVNRLRGKQYPQLCRTSFRSSSVWIYSAFFSIAVIVISERMVETVM